MHVLRLDDPPWVPVQDCEYGVLVCASQRPRESVFVSSDHRPGCPIASLVGPMILASVLYTLGNTTLVGVPLESVVAEESTIAIPEAVESLVPGSTASKAVPATSAPPPHLEWADLWKGFKSDVVLSEVPPGKNPETHMRSLADFVREKGSCVKDFFTANLPRMSETEKAKRALRDASETQLKVASWQQEMAKKMAKNLLSFLCTKAGTVLYKPTGAALSLFEHPKWEDGDGPKYGEFYEDVLSKLFAKKDLGRLAWLVTHPRSTLEDLRKWRPGFALGTHPLGEALQVIEDVLSKKFPKKEEDEEGTSPLYEDLVRLAWSMAKGTGSMVTHPRRTLEDLRKSRPGLALGTHLGWIHDATHPGHPLGEALQVIETVLLFGPRRASDILSKMNRTYQFFEAASYNTSEALNGDNVWRAPPHVPFRIQSDLVYPMARFISVLPSLGRESVLEALHMTCDTGLVVSPARFAFSILKEIISFYEKHPIWGAIIVFAAIGMTRTFAGVVGAPKIAESIGVQEAMKELHSKTALALRWQGSLKSFYKQYNHNMTVCDAKGYAPRSFLDVCPPVSWEEWAGHVNHLKGIPKTKPMMTQLALCISHVYDIKNGTSTQDDFAFWMYKMSFDRPEGLADPAAYGDVMLYPDPVKTCAFGFADKPIILGADALRLIKGVIGEKFPYKASECFKDSPVTPSAWVEHLVVLDQTICQPSKLWEDLFRVVECGASDGLRKVSPKIMEDASSQFVRDVWSFIDFCNNPFEAMVTSTPQHVEKYQAQITACNNPIEALVETVAVQCGTQILRAVDNLKEESFLNIVDANIASLVAVTDSIGENISGVNLAAKVLEEVRKAYKEMTDLIDAANDRPLMLYGTLVVTSSGATGVITYRFCVRRCPDARQVLISEVQVLDHNDTPRLSPIEDASDPIEDATLERDWGGD